jgi:hypothetical protein
MLRPVAFVLGFVLVCFALFTGTALASTLLVGTALMGLPAVLPRSNPATLASRTSLAALAAP